MGYVRFEVYVLFRDWWNAPPTSQRNDWLSLHPDGALGDRDVGVWEERRSPRSRLTRPGQILSGQLTHRREECPMLSRPSWTANADAPRKRPRLPLVGGLSEAPSCDAIGAESYRAKTPLHVREHLSVAIRSLADVRTASSLDRLRLQMVLGRRRTAVLECRSG